VRHPFPEGCFAGREETRAPEAPDEAAAEAALTEEEDEALRRTLEGLGYL